MWRVIFFLLWSSTAFSVTEHMILDAVSKDSLVDPHLVLSVIKVESNFKPKAISVDKGRRHLGLMQICVATAKTMGFRGTEKELWNWRNNVHYGSKYLSYQLFRYDFNTLDAVAAYNAGSVFRRKNGYANDKYVSAVMSVYNTYKRRKRKMIFTLSDVWKPYYKRWL